MAELKVLFIGGSGVISSASSRLAVERGIDLCVLNRGTSHDRPLPPGATVLHADVHDHAAVREALGDLEFDAVVDWVAFTPEHVRSDIELFRGRTGQYVFISSASAYQTRRPGSRSPSPRRCATRTGSTPGTRSPARTCSPRRTGRRASRLRWCGRRTPTTRR